MASAAAIAVPAILKGVTSFFGGQQSRSAINNALEAMLNSFGTAGSTMKGAVEQANPEVLRDAWHWGDMVNASAQDAATAARAAAERGITGVNEAVAGGQAAVQPYQAAGGQALATLLNVLQKPQQYQYQADPGYQFRLQEGQKAIQRAAAASGASGGGGTAKALAQYNSGLASQEYGAGFNRFMQQQQLRQSGLAGVAGLGERAGEYAGDLGFRGATTTAGLGTNAAQYGGNALMNAMQWAGNAGMGAQRWASTNELDLGNFLANLDIQGGKARAGADLAKAGVWNDVLGGIGSAAASLPWAKWLRGGGGGIGPTGYDPSNPSPAG